MRHQLFGPLKFNDVGRYWAGSANLARFAAYGAKTPETTPTETEARRLIADLNRSIDTLRGQLGGLSGPPAVTELDAEVETAPAKPVATGPRGRGKTRAEKAAQRADRLSRGWYPVRVADPTGNGPRPEQEAAFHHLTEHEAAVLEAVLGQLSASCRRTPDGDEGRQTVVVAPTVPPADLRGRVAVVRVTVAREHRDGFAHLVFTINPDREDDRGLFVVYSPASRVAACADGDGLSDLLTSDDAEAEYELSPHDALVEAVLNGDENRARVLAAAGADVNALAPGEYPPLCMAVDQAEVEEVRRLLAYGADPNLPDPVEKKTPLATAKRMYKEMGFGPAKKHDALFEAMMAMAREAAGKRFGEMKPRLEEIIRLLETAGGR